jgi:hypothetical protein
MNADELSRKYSNDSTRRRLFALMDIRLLLEHCLIKGDYRVTQNLYDPIVPTPAGERFIDGIRKKGLAYPEARMLCLLELFHVDLFVDPDQSDLERLIRVVGTQIRDSQIRYPFTYGRLLYDKALDQGYREDRYTLGEAETHELLDGTPQGVFQSGSLVTGPFGILRSESSRYLPPVLSIPYHCNDNCRRIHRRWLTTSEAAPINEHRTKVRKQLERESKDPSEWREFLARSVEAEDSPYNDLARDPIGNLLGDCLDLAETKSLVSWLLDNTSGSLRATAGGLGLRGRAEGIVSDLNQAELLQLALTVSSRRLFNGLDILVSRGMIRIPDGEIRKPVVSGTEGFGWYGLVAQLGRYGVRLHSLTTDIAPLRLRRLIGQMYRLDKPDDRHELEWQLRGEHADSLEARLEQYLQSHRPREIVSSLLLARRSNMVVALQELELSEDILESDPERINAVLWKLGFSVEDSFDVHKGFWEVHARMVQQTRQTMVGPLAADSDKIRSLAANYFVGLESLLRDSLLYTTWALTTDHFASAKPYIYQPSLDERAALQTLDEHASADTDDAGKQRLSFSEKITLYPLTRGFQVLADLLESLESTEEEFVRDGKAVPSWVRLQNIQHFPFIHRVPFLDLLEDSRKQIKSRLREISQRLVGADVSEARNEWLHARKGSLGVDQLRRSLDAVRDAIVLIQDSGFSRQTYRQIRSEFDEAHRETVVLADGRGQEVVLFRPSHLEWLGLPGLRQTQHVMTSARFHEPAEVLRFATETDSPYSRLWAGYPARSARSGRMLARPHARASESA